MGGHTWQGPIGREIVRLAEAHPEWSFAKIADETGSTCAAVKGVISYARRDGRVRKFKKRLPNIALYPDTIQTLELAGRTRGLAAANMAATLLEHLVKHKLIDAIMDDLDEK